MQLTRLIYTSHHGGLCAEAVDLILQKSRTNNVRDGISGALIVGEKNFVQLLEGDRAVVAKCFMRIMQDDRHGEIQVIFAADANHRLFFEWSMHCIITSRIKQQILSRYTINGVFDPVHMSQHAIEDMCRTLSEGNWQMQAA